MEDLNAEELTLLTSVIDEDEPSSSLQSVSHDPAKERDPAVQRPLVCKAYPAATSQGLWKSVFGLDDMSLARRVQQVLPLPQRQPLPQLLPKSGPETLQDRDVERALQKWCRLSHRQWPSCCRAFRRSRSPWRTWWFLGRDVGPPLHSCGLLKFVDRGIDRLHLGSSTNSTVAVSTGWS